MRVVERDGRVVVERANGRPVCTGFPVTVAHGQRRLTGILFIDERERKNNRTRQAAMRALQKAGWR